MAYGIIPDLLPAGVRYDSYSNRYKYTVKSGDSLGQIALNISGDSSKFTQIRDSAGRKLSTTVIHPGNVLDVTMLITGVEPEEPPEISSISSTESTITAVVKGISSKSVKYLNIKLSGKQIG